MELFIAKALPKKSKVYKTYWKFAEERQNIFFKRFYGSNEWTDDQILKRHKFTNAYRASDRVSQYLIKNVIYKYSSDPKEVLFRILVFKTFNKIETWELLMKRLGTISYESFDFKAYDDILSTLMINGISIYSGAYIMTSGKSRFGYEKKHQNHLKLIDYMMKNGFAEKVSNSTSMEILFNTLKQYPTIGNFLAYQYTIDINYSEVVDFDEMDFVFPGPGALDGIRKCFTDLGDYDEAEIIKYVTESQHREFQLNDIDFKDLWSRPLQLIDCQNLFCEVDKYARVAHPEVSGISGRSRIKQIFRPKEESIKYWYPPKWKINDRINNNYE
ncbi:MAG TPA: nucleotide kinase domain-containing protein [Gillisia sp.]|nr:nucleotide kinase domain-containing protein [Gillisia sp.]